MDAADAKQADRGAKAPWSWPPRLNRSMEIPAGLLVAPSAFGAGRGQAERSASAMERSRARRKFDRRLNPPLRSATALLYAGDHR
ncbi:hypothetical protein [Lysobacter sp. CCNWLW3]|uniref:hypothetical protein n=1 Tax=Lysobacter sp. CCNWLW3 TaxID=3117014 RepID=UPI002FCFB21C